MQPSIFIISFVLATCVLINKTFKIQKFVKSLECKLLFFFSYFWRFLLQWSNIQKNCHVSFLKDIFLWLKLDHGILFIHLFHTIQLSIILLDIYLCNLLEVVPLISLSWHASLFVISFRCSIILQFSFWSLRNINMRCIEKVHCLCST